MEDTGIYWVEISDDKSVIESNRCLLIVAKGIPVYNIGTIAILVALLAFGSCILINRKQVKL